MKILWHKIGGWLDSWVGSKGLIEATWSYWGQKEMLLVLESGLHVLYSTWVGPIPICLYFKVPGQGKIKNSLGSLGSPDLRLF